jgi:hypothetical protein
MRIGELEEKLLKLFPASAAESWDRTGMLVGDPDDEVAGVARDFVKRPFRRATGEYHDIDFIAGLRYADYVSVVLSSTIQTV